MLRRSENTSVGFYLRCCQLWQDRRRQRYGNGKAVCRKCSSRRYGGVFTHKQTRASVSTKQGKFAVCVCQRFCLFKSSIFISSGLLAVSAALVFYLKRKTTHRSVWDENDSDEYVRTVDDKRAPWSSGIYRLIVSAAPSCIHTIRTACWQAFSPTPCQHRSVYHVNIIYGSNPCVTQQVLCNLCLWTFPQQNTTWWIQYTENLPSGVVFRKTTLLSEDLQMH